MTTVPTWLLLLQPDLELLPLVIQILVERHPRIGLPLEEGVVQLLVVNVNLAQLGPDLLAHLRLHRLGVLLVLEGGAHLHDTWKDMK